MLDIAKKAIPRAASNPYYQAKRYPVENKLFYHIKEVDILMVIDKDRNAIYFQLWSALRRLLGMQGEEKTTDSFEKYSTLAPVPLPDATRHGLHWTDWLKEHPEFDFQNPANDLRQAKSGVYHLGGHCETGDSQGRKGYTQLQIAAREWQTGPCPETTGNSSIQRPGENYRNP